MLLAHEFRLCKIHGCVDGAMCRHILWKIAHKKLENKFNQMNCILVNLKCFETLITNLNKRRPDNIICYFDNNMYAHLVIKGVLHR